jgi:alpha-tubulin suppressor-like RCC1 family protein
MHRHGRLLRRRVWATVGLGCVLSIAILTVFVSSSFGQTGATTSKYLSVVHSSLSVGDSHACYLQAGVIKCWGDNSAGELGDGTTTNQAYPVTVENIGKAKAISAGTRYTCALLTDGSVECWGTNNTGQLGDGTRTDSSIPVAVSGITTVVQVSAGGANTCALLRNQTVVCWGSNYNGQLGNGEQFKSLIPVGVKGLTKAIQVSAGLRHSCALLASGRIYCWGWGVYGQLGNGSNHSSRVPVRVSGITNAVQVSAGGGQTCALITGGIVKCWGYNGSGELGIGSWRPVTSSKPLEAALPAKAVAISSGYDNSCARLTTGTVYCWGSNESGELGVGKTFWKISRSYKPLPVQGLSQVTEVSVGDETICADTRLVVKCWGEGGSGQLGNGATGIEATPVTAVGIKNATAVNAAGSFSCAVLEDGRVTCWGRDFSGQLGLNTKIEVRAKPVIVPGVENAVQVSGGPDHACALNTDGTISCWGKNNQGQLGNGTWVDSITPVKVKEIANAIAVGVGDVFSCALRADHSVWCWGVNSASQLGNGTTKARSTPSKVPGITNAISLSVSGGDTSCAVAAGGTVWCWGGYNPNDPNSSNGSAKAVPIGGITNAVQASSDSQCALLTGGTISCWGVDPENPDAGNSIHAISGITNATSISGSCALLAGGGVDCWGGSFYGQLGNGTVSVSGSGDTAVAVFGLTNATAISGSGFNACAVVAGGKVECWGWNWWGALGNGKMGFSTLPTKVIGLS